jgi:hypothetical protein
MSAERTKDPKARREAWLDSLRAELDKLAPMMPESPLPDDTDLPPWVARVEAEFAKAMFPAAQLKKGRDITPKRMGSVLGHMCNNAVWFMEQCGKAPTAADAQAIREMDQVALKTHVTTLLEMVRKWYPGMRRLAKRALCSSVDQPFEDMADFLTGFGDGFARKPKSGSISEFGSTNFEIYLFMLSNWRSIAVMESLPAFHRVLVKRFGAHQVGEQKRIEKLCQRVGLSFRKPGRPPQAQ